MLSQLSTSSVGTLFHGGAAGLLNLGRQHRRRRRRRRAVAAVAAPAGSSSAARPTNKPDTTAPVPQPTTLEELYWALRKDQLTELRIGWRDCDYLQSHRNVATLERALRGAAATAAANASNASRLRSISIGWRSHTRDPSVLWHFLQVLARTKGLKLDRLQLCLDRSRWVPESVLRNLMLHHAGLVSIELQSVRVLRRIGHTGHYGKDYCCAENEEWLNAPGCGCSGRGGGGGGGSASGRCDHSVISRVLVRLHHHESLKSLSLVDCDVTDASAVALADYLHIRGGLARLSLRGNNRYLGVRGIRVICQAPVMDRLDLSLCDLDPIDAQAVAVSIAKRPWPLGELVLSGNYRMDIKGLLALTSQSCCDKLVALNISYCDIGPHKAKSIIESLKNLEPGTTLQQINLQGSRFTGGAGAADPCDYDFAQGLRQLLSKNNSLRVVRINDPSNPQNMTSRELNDLLAGLRLNYEVEELQFDSLRSAQEMSIRKKMDFFIRLNRAGRRILLSPPPPIHLRVGRRGKNGDDAAATTGTHNTNSNKSQQVVEQRKILDNSKNSSTRQQRRQQQLLQKPDEAWFQVLEKAGEDLDVLFWIVSESAERFEANARARQQRQSRSVS